MPTELVKALLHTRAILDELGIPNALMGGLAVAAWDHIRATDDVDMLVAVAEADWPSLVTSFEQRDGFRRKLFEPILDFDGERVLQLMYQPPGKFFDFQVDLFLAESEFHRAALARRTPFTLPDGSATVPILTREDLILFKLIAARIIDRRDVVSIVSTDRTAIDFAYLKSWLSRLGVSNVWQECWSNAFPGEPDPTATD
ncbi:MAG: hypothetical protein U0746_18365 [Gemmataceae bacterium]